MMAAFTTGCHMYGGYSVIRDHCLQMSGSNFNCLVSIINHYFFTKCIDVLFGSSGDAYSIRILRSKHYRITYFITPQSTVRGNNHGIRFIHLYIPEQNGFWLSIIPLSFRNELIKDTVVRKDE